MKNSSLRFLMRWPFWGRVPIVIGGDFNIDCELSDNLQSFLGTGQYFDAIRWKAHQQGLEPDGACLNSGNRLDYMILNREAFAAFTDGGTLSDPVSPARKPVFVDLTFDSFKQRCNIIYPAKDSCSEGLGRLTGATSVVVG